MKKNILLIGLALSMLTSGISAFAAEEEIMPINAEEDIMLIAEDETMLISEDEPALIEEEKAPSITAEEITIGEDKDFELIYDNTGKKLTAEDLKDGDKALLFMEGEDKVALVVMNEDVASMAAIDTFKASETLGEFVDTMNNLAINVADETVIVDTEDKELTKEDIDGKKLMVFYSFATMSIPAQTTPEKIVVIGEGEVIEDTEATEDVENTEDTVEKVTYTVKAEAIRKDGELVTLPLREVAEGLGYEVGWDDTLKKITVGTVPMGVNFVLGVNEYNKSRMMPFTLEKAPELVIFGDFGITYVPASFFTEVLGGEIAENEDGTIVVTL